MRRRIAEGAKEHYRLLFERNLAGVFRSRVDGRMVECNEAFARLLGYRTPPDVLRHNARDFYVDSADRDALLERLRTDRRVANHETRWRRPNGEAFTVMMNATQIGRGGEAHVEGIVLDITERKRAEEALREREAQLRNLGDNLPDGVIYQVVRRADGSNYFPYMSSGLESTFGATAGAAMADAGLVYRMVLPEDLARIRAASDESIRTGGPVDVEYRMRTPSGAIRWMNLRGRPSPLADGATRWDVVALDVTERKRAEEALRERESELRALTDTLRRSEARYRLLFERSFVGIFRTRADGILMECNDAFARILGYDGAAQVRGRSVIGHYATPADRDTVVARLAAGEEVIDVELTDRKRAEEATTLRSVAELANAAAHEINNPLTVILGELHLMQREVRPAVDRIEEARAAVMRIRDIVKHMVQVTRLEPSTGWPPGLPPMLDIRRSGPPRPPDRTPG
jgi:PAS domain S-box-containing protein